MEVGHDSLTSHLKTRKRMDYTNVRYSLTLNDKQIEALSDGNCKINRMMCLHTMLRLAGMESSTVTKKGFSGETQIGQFVIEMEKFGELIGGDKKTAERIVADFVRLGLIEKQGNNRTTLLTIKCLSVWFCDGRTTIKNPFFNINPTVLPKKPRKVYQKKSCVSAEVDTNNTLIDDGNSNVKPESIETQNVITPIGSIDSASTDDGIELTKVESVDNPSSLIPNGEGVSVGVGEECDGCNEEAFTTNIVAEDKSEDVSSTESRQAHYMKTSRNKKLSKKERRAQKRLQQKGCKH